MEFDFRTLQSERYLDFKNVDIKEFFHGNVEEDTIEISKKMCFGWRSFALCRYFQLEQNQKQFEKEIDYDNVDPLDLDSPSAPFYFLEDKSVQDPEEYEGDEPPILYKREYKAIYFPLHPDIAPGFIILEVSGQSHNCFSEENSCDYKFTCYGDVAKFPGIENRKPDGFQMDNDWFLVYCKRSYPHYLDEMDYYSDFFYRECTW
ncbi:hypothetical protein HK098_000541 [Nowakowskiella sp. JEL0407]|nr:hypothetical protein HK098_000541 [Nowakowskiella sp. JEL0407]